MVQTQLEPRYSVSDFKLEVRRLFATSCLPVSPRCCGSNLMPGGGRAGSSICDYDIGEESEATHEASEKGDVV
jgi:hypothetical protein